MTVVKMDQPHLKLYTVPNTMQPMRGMPLTMSGMGMGIRRLTVKPAWLEKLQGFQPQRTKSGRRIVL